MFALDLVVLGAVVACILYLAVLRHAPFRRANGPDTPKKAIVSTTAPLKQVEQDKLTPMPADFDVMKEPVAQHRPYKPVYHMSMSIQNCLTNDEFIFDHQYLDRIQGRVKTLQDKPAMCFGYLPQAVPAMREFYTYLLGTWLPTRMPQHFEMSCEHQTLTNHLTGKTHPLTPPEDPLELMTIICWLVEDDISFLSPVEDKTSPDYGLYQLTGFLTCYLAGFEMANKLGLVLRDIHTSVPLYKEKLELSMDRFFSKLVVGKIIRRFNWGITTHTNLFAPEGNHLYEGEENKYEPISIQQAENCVMRSERQILRRLPQTKVLCFSVKTYLYPLKQLKAEGQGEALATAIDGLPHKLAFYKSRPRWGEAVKAYLRS